MTSVSKWTLRAGVTCVLLGVLSWLIADLLPIDLMPRLSSFFSGVPLSPYSYMRVVPAEKSLFFEYLIGIGLLLTALGFCVRPKK